MLLTAIGTLATVLSGWAHPFQAAHVWWNRKHVEVIKGVSLLSVILITTAASCWIGYGFRFQGMFASLLAIIEVACQLVVVIALRLSHVLSFKLLMAYTTWVLFLAVFTITAPVVVLGAAGAALSMGMFIPQAVRMWLNRATPAAFAVSPITAIIMVFANTLWLLYGLALKDFWLTAPCVVHICSAITMLCVSLAWYKSPQRSRT